MPSIQIRNLSQAVYCLLKQMAKANRRSIQREATWILEAALNFPGRLHQPDWSQADAIHNLMKQRYGLLPDSTALIRKMLDEH